ncbi:hypothetical protein E4K10_33175 [Streptomyces sp. T1317-0309]|nr:hypothetical protein E4K10_33175 [Streptomyces sp. T1317-0309]
MTQRTARPAAGLEALPLDLKAMRESARRLLAGDAEPPTVQELLNLGTLLRDHIRQLAPEVESAARRQPKDDIPRACALACVGEARMRLRLGEGDNDALRLSVATKLARSVNALCDHAVNLGMVGE